MPSKLSGLLIQLRRWALLVIEEQIFQFSKVVESFRIGLGFRASFQLKQFCFDLSRCVGPRFRGQMRLAESDTVPLKVIQGVDRFFVAGLPNPVPDTGLIAPRQRDTGTVCPEG